MNKKTITRIIITLVFGLIYFYIALPPLNFQSFSFLMFILLTMMIYIASGVVNILDIKRIFNKTTIF